MSKQWWKDVGQSEPLECPSCEKLAAEIKDLVSATEWIAANWGRVFWKTRPGAVPQLCGRMPFTPGVTPLYGGDTRGQALQVMWQHERDR